MVISFDLPAIVFAAALVFARMGAILMLLPGFAEPGIPIRIRLSFALAFSFAIGPVVAPMLPVQPETLAGLAGYVTGEVIIGLMIGGAARMLLASASVAGQVIGYQSGLAMAQAFDPAQGQTGALPATFLNLLFIVLLFTTNLHHLLLQAAAGSYMMMPPGQAPMWGDAAQWAVDIFISAFNIGIQLAAPLVLFGLVFYLGLGVLSRMMPQVQIFFVAMPMNILVGFTIFSLALGTMAMVWLDRVEAFTATLM
ncbi:flagellar biosynthetic protein FliR [Glycocaulis sp.]|uniref:flagellar biosynthetic protein FliR n=1 Tax=Glycocaulis sp. TaxID=1969725 RepID=UPI003D1B5BA8